MKIFFTKHNKRHNIRSLESSFTGFITLRLLHSHVPSEQARVGHSWLALREDKSLFHFVERTAPLEMHSYSDGVKFLLLPANGSETHGQRKAPDVTMSPQNVRLQG